MTTVLSPGSPKGSTELAEFLEIATNNRLRQRRMPGASVATIDIRERKYEQSSGSIGHSRPWATAR